MYAAFVDADGNRLNMPQPNSMLPVAPLARPVKQFI
jgi:hypothetical protein